MEFEFTKNDTSIAKGVALILMYIHHLFGFPDRIINGNYYTSIFQLWGANVELQLGIFGNICVCMFMVLCGFGTYKTYRNNSKNYNFIKEKLINFYKIYWMVFFVFILLGCAMGYQRNFNFFELINNITCYNITYNGEWWFATPFISTMLLFPLLVKTYNRMKSKSLIADVFCILTFAVVVRTIVPAIINIQYFNEFRESSYWRILFNTLQLLPSFLSGCICAKYNLFIKFRQKFQNKICLFSCSLFIIIIVFVCRNKTLMSTNWDYIYAPLFIIAITSILRELKNVTKIFVAIGKKSTYMWLMHSFFCYQYFQYITYRLHNSLLILFSLIIVTYFIACILSKLNRIIYLKISTPFSLPEKGAI